MPRPSGRERLLFFIVAIGLICNGGAALAASDAVAPGGAADVAKEAAHVREVSVLDDNQDDMNAVQNVCTACHSSFQYLSTPRSWERWEQVFAEMTGYGADPTDAQVDQIVRYFQRNLTVVNANTSPPDELAATLQLGEATADAVIARRERKKFSGLDDLATVPGVNKTVLRALKTNLQF